jgi:signal transduction histidine kinase
MALRITLIYAVVSGLWILLSDRMLFTMVQDRQVASHLSTYKGWVFVAVTGWMLYALIRSMFAQVAKSQEEAAEAKRQFYRGTVYSVTDGKLDLCSRGEISAQMPDDMETVNISSEADLAKLRDRVKQLAQSKCMPDDQTHSFVTAVGEAAANAVKHAGEGTACLAGRDGKVQVCIQDKGPGIDTLTLP